MNQVLQQTQSEPAIKTTMDTNSSNINNGPHNEHHPTSVDEPKVSPLDSDAIHSLLGSPKSYTTSNPRPQTQSQTSSTTAPNNYNKKDALRPPKSLSVSITRPSSLSRSASSSASPNPLKSPQVISQVITSSAMTPSGLRNNFDIAVKCISPGLPKNMLSEMRNVVLLSKSIEVQQRELIAKKNSNGDGKANVNLNKRSPSASKSDSDDNTPALNNNKRKIDQVDSTKQNNNETDKNDLDNDKEKIEIQSLIISTPKSASKTSPTSASKSTPNLNSNSISPKSSTKRLKRRVPPPLSTLPSRENLLPSEISASIRSAPLKPNMMIPFTSRPSQQYHYPNCGPLSARIRTNTMTNSQQRFRGTRCARPSLHQLGYNRQRHRYGMLTPGSKPTTVSKNVRGNEASNSKNDNGSKKTKGSIRSPHVADVFPDESIRFAPQMSQPISARNEFFSFNTRRNENRSNSGSSSKSNLRTTSNSDNESSKKDNDNDDMDIDEDDVETNAIEDDAVTFQSQLQLFKNQHQYKIFRLNNNNKFQRGIVHHQDNVSGKDVYSLMQSENKQQFMKICSEVWDKYSTTA